MGAIFAVPVARVDDSAELPGGDVALVAARTGDAADAARVDGPVTIVVGAERDGLPDDVVAACDARRAHPDRERVAERRDGGDRRALRADQRSCGCRA